MSARRTNRPPFQASIDENLCRSELSPADRAKQTARRKAIYLELHPETVHGANQHTKVGADNLSTPNFAEATAAVTGTDARTVRRDVERGEKVCQFIARCLCAAGVYASRRAKEPEVYGTDHPSGLPPLLPALTAQPIEKVRG
jgi:hypothetical protein